MANCITFQSRGSLQFFVRPFACLTACVVRWGRQLEQLCGCDLCRNYTSLAILKARAQRRQSINWVQQLPTRKARQTLAVEQPPTNNRRRQPYGGLGDVRTDVEKQTAHLTKNKRGQPQQRRNDDDSDARTVDASLAQRTCSYVFW